ncbi:hypothetical protein NVS89_00145 [Ancylobacter sp. MQZ15Z-1]|uniref:Uncharacterized protein n=1 Tax=Ancylobacter mangrovi TaxID=2972472 RepID=A0A9X2PAT5_9HYPH|nr:hypothetical protein [Ancylobacter mangrovi]MCS0493486.1 hypothetical protein [Ancylobacter mangrovi]
MAPWIVVLLGSLFIAAAIARARRRSDPGAWVGIAALIGLTLWLAGLAREHLVEGPAPAPAITTLDPPPALRDHPSPFGNDG